MRSPVYYTHHDYRSFYWVSVPEAHHSGNIARHPEIEIVIFDSTAAPNRGEAVYLSATAREIPPDELAAECALAYRSGKDGIVFAPEELTGGAKLRLYRADAVTTEVHVRAGHPALGTGADHREPVDVTRA